MVVAIPEEMAVVEAAWFHRLATQEIGIARAAVVLNGCHERRFTSDEEAEVLRLCAEGADGRAQPATSALGAALGAARRHIRRRKLTPFYEKRLRRDARRAARLAAVPVPRDASAPTRCGCSRGGSRPREGGSAPGRAARGRPQGAARARRVRRGRRRQDDDRRRPRAPGRAARPARAGLHDRPVAAPRDQPRPLRSSRGKPRAADLDALRPQARGGAMWAMTLDTKGTFDALVERYAQQRRGRDGASWTTASTSRSRPRSPAATSTWRWRSSSSCSPTSASTW